MLKENVFLDEEKKDCTILTYQHLLICIQSIVLYYNHPLLLELIKFFTFPSSKINYGSSTLHDKWIKDPPLKISVESHNSIIGIPNYKCFYEEMLFISIPSFQFTNLNTFPPVKLKKDFLDKYKLMKYSISLENCRVGIASNPYFLNSININVCFF